ncbi:MAG: hypothetical protein ACREB8_14335 [Pseudolabrys sp.]
MCIACELTFWNMIDALPPEEQGHILREQAARFACEAPEGEPPAAQSATDERRS